MRKSRAVFLSALMSAMAVGTLVTPVAAADPRLAFVNGIPGTSVDVCIGTREVKSGLRYGRWFDRVVAPGVHALKFRKAGPGKCQGRTLARMSLNLEANVDGTIVATSRSPKLVSFNNKLAPAPVGNVNWVAFRQASDIGGVILSMTQGQVVEPSAAPEAFEKGDQWKVSLGSGAESPLTFATYLPTKASPFAGPEQILTYAPRRHELILVGSTTSNAKLVTIVRPTIAP